MIDFAVGTAVTVFGTGNQPPASAGQCRTYQPILFERAVLQLIAQLLGSGPRQRYCQQGENCQQEKALYGGVPFGVISRKYF